MTIRKDIVMLNNQLQRGDKQKLSKMSGVSMPTIIRFFNGDEEMIIEETQNKIIDAALILIKQRKERAKDRSKLISSILS
jgi:hypothetical protein